MPCRCSISLWPLTALPHWLTTALPSSVPQYETTSGNLSGSSAVAPPRAAIALQPNLAEALVAQARVFDADQTTRKPDDALKKPSDSSPTAMACTISWVRPTSPPTVGRKPSIVPQALEATGDDYNTYVPFINAVQALHQDQTVSMLIHKQVEVLEKQIKAVPEDMRARNLVANRYALLGKTEDAESEMKMAVALRPNDPSVLYNAACSYAILGNKPEALAMLGKSKAAGFRDANWARRDPDLACLHNDPEFERLYPASSEG